jgi:hypothetical protein
MAATPATAAVMARMVSTGLDAATTTGAIATRPDAGAGRAAGCAAAVAAAGARGAAVVVRCAATGAAVPAGGRAAGEAPGMPPGAPVGPPGGNVGNLIVGAAEGLGGNVIRTVSFFGWTLPVDFFIGVTGEPGIPGGTGGCGLSAIVFRFKIRPTNELSNKFSLELKVCAGPPRIQNGGSQAEVQSCDWESLGIGNRTHRTYETYVRSA